MKKNGFTLIELMVTVAIMAVLAAGALVAINPQQRINDATNTTRKRNLQSVASAMETCFSKNNGLWTTCDSQTELQTGGFVRNAVPDVIVGVNTTATSCSSGGPCCAFAQEAGVVTYLRYSSVSGAITGSNSGSLCD